MDKDKEREIQATKNYIETLQWEMREYTSINANKIRQEKIYMDYILNN